MIQKKQFSFGGLQIELSVHPQFGCVTTTQHFADIVGISDRNVRILLKKHELRDQHLAEEDVEFRKNISETSHTLGGRPSAILLNVKGMIFLTMLLRTERAMAFRKEVLETIEKMEAQGYTDWAAVEARLNKQDEKIDSLLAIVAKQADDNQKLLVVVFNQQEKIEHLEEKLGYKAKADKLRRSADGKRLAAGRYEKKIEEMQ